MIVAGHSLLGGGLASVTLGSLTLSAAPNGNFSPYTVPTVVYGNGKVFYGWVDGSNGNIAVGEVSQYPGTVTITTLKAALEADAHDSPALLIRSSDHKLLAIYGRHNNNDIYRRISTNAYDSTAWGTETNLASSLGATRYTDWQIHQLNGMTGSPIVLFYRDEPTAGTDSRWVMSTSSDGGSTFSAQTIIYHVTSARSYLTSWSDSNTRIDFLASNSTGAATHVIGHFYYDNGSWFASDGTSLGSPPFDQTKLTTIYSGTDLGLPSFVANAGGTPVVTYWTRQAANSYSHHYARWSGAAWNATTLASGLAGVTYELDSSTAPLHASPDDADPTLAYSFEDTGSGNPQLYRYVMSTAAAILSKTALTATGTGHQGVPTPVRFRSDGLRVLWQFGTLTNYVTFSLGTRGLTR